MGINETELKLPDMPDCWKTCGACSSDELLVSDVFVKPGVQLNLGDPLIEVETDKTTIEIPAAQSGYVINVLVEVGDSLFADSVILTFRK